LDQSQTDQIAAQAAQFVKEYPVSSFDQKLIENNDYRSWVVESWQNASKDVYPNVQEGQVITE
jgi:hypothetical protein